MAHAAGKWAALFFACRTVCCGEEPEAVLERFLAKMEAELRRLPDHVCTQRIERFTRAIGGGEWKREDTVAFTVGIAAGREVYAAPDGSIVDDPSLAGLVRKGVISSGQFGLLARHVFSWNAARFGYRGESERAGRKAFEFEFEVPREKSAYSLRMGSAAEIVAFQGSFHVDAETLDLLELEVQAFDIPESLGLAQADTRVVYSPTDVRGAVALLPTSATLLVATADGLERLNRARFGDCKRFDAESALLADQQPAQPAPEDPQPARLAPGSILDVQLDMDLVPQFLKQGDPVRARLVRPAEAPAGQPLPPGAILHGAVASLASGDIPFPTYEIVLEFTALEAGGEVIPLSATLVEVAPERGLIRESKRFMPSFSKRQNPRLDVLVREVRKGQGVLLWDARRPAIPKGLRMKWRVSPDSPLLAADKHQ